MNNIENIPKTGPILLLSNHQNALLDALLIATTCGRFSYFLTRAAVFEKPLINTLLRSLRMLPVYRIRDGWQTLNNNMAIFDICSELLKDGEVVTIFPEGSHNLKRTVRPFSKGFTRIVFNTLEKYPETNLKLVPVGLNFIKAEGFPDSASIYFGNPVLAEDFRNENRNEAVKDLKEKLQSEISKLTTHIPPSDYDENLQMLESLNVDFLNPQETNQCIANNFNDVSSNRRSKKSTLSLFFKPLLVLNTLVPYVIWKFFVKPKIDEIEFLSTFRFTIAITLVPIYLFILALLITTYFGIKIALAYLLLVLVTTLIAVKL